LNLDQFAPLLNRSPVVRTGEPEAMEHALLTVYGAKGFSVSKADSFEGVGNYLQLANVGLGFCAYGGHRRLSGERLRPLANWPQRQRGDHSERYGTRDK
jgi:hypothetical protein